MHQPSIANGCVDRDAAKPEQVAQPSRPSTGAWPRQPSCRT